MIYVTDVGTPAIMVTKAPSLTLIGSMLTNIIVQCKTINHKYAIQLAHCLRQRDNKMRQRLQEIVRVLYNYCIEPDNIL